MSAEAAPAPAPARPNLGLDMDYHESTHSRNVRSMSTRKLVTNRHDDLLRSGSTHQLLNRPYNANTVMGGAASGTSLLGAIPGEASARPPPPAGAAESMTTEETAEDSDSEGSDFSGGSFCDASGDCAADREYLRKDLGASLHDDELEFDSGDEAGDDDMIAAIKNRMKIEGAPGSGDDAAAEASS